MPAEGLLLVVVTPLRVAPCRFCRLRMDWERPVATGGSTRWSGVFERVCWDC